MTLHLGRLQITVAWGRRSPSGRSPDSVAKQQPPTPGKKGVLPTILRVSVMDDERECELERKQGGRDRPWERD